jgi:predicted RNA binding protein YcfA (HicA-like mRNA interferase family)
VFGTGLRREPRSRICWRETSPRKCQNIARADTYRQAARFLVACGCVPSTIPAVSGATLVKALESASFAAARINGGHRSMGHPDGRSAIVPSMGPDVPKGVEVQGGGMDGWQNSPWCSLANAQLTRREG